jgi:hypothetical protein
MFGLNEKTFKEIAGESFQTSFNLYEYSQNSRKLLSLAG